MKLEPTKNSSLLSEGCGCGDISGAGKQELGRAELTAPLHAGVGGQDNAGTEPRRESSFHSWGFGELAGCTQVSETRSPWNPAPYPVQLLPKHDSEIYLHIMNKENHLLFPVAERNLRMRLPGTRCGLCLWLFLTQRVPQAFPFLYICFSDMFLFLFIIVFKERK